MALATTSTDSSGSSECLPTIKTELCVVKKEWSMNEEFKKQLEEKERVIQKIRGLARKYKALWEESQATANVESRLSGGTLSKNTEEKQSKAMKNSTAPRIEVPMDFGLELLGSPSHGNLTLELAPGLDSVKVNTAIMSYNSPVIYRLTTELHQNSVDMVEFSTEAVYCFSRACYSGRLDELELHLFRQIYKMAVVLKVVWLQNRCVWLYQEFVRSALQKEYNYTDLFVLHKEAEYAYSQMKAKDLLLFLIAELDKNTAKKELFINEYIKDIDFLSTNEAKRLM